DGDAEKTAKLLSEAFSDRQTWCDGTKQAQNGLYHAQVSPAPKYAQTMIDEQWLRCVDTSAKSSAASASICARGSPTAGSSPWSTSTSDTSTRGNAALDRSRQKHMQPDSLHSACAPRRPKPAPSPSNSGVHIQRRTP